MNALQKGTVSAVCFDNGSLKLDAVPDILNIFATDPASISAKFTASDAAVKAIRCEFPKDSIVELLKQQDANISKVLFACKDSTGAVFASWNGSQFVRGGTAPNPEPNPEPKPSSPTSTDPAKPNACVNIADVFANPLLVFGGACFNVLPSGATLSIGKLDVNAIVNDIKNGKPITVTGDYKRGDSTFTVQCTVAPSTLTALLPLLQGNGAKIDLQQLRGALRVSCGTADGKHLFGVDGDDISGIDVDGSTVTVGGVKINLDGIVHRIVNGKSLEVLGFVVKDGVLVTPSGQSIKFDPSDLVSFLQNAVVVVNKDGSITIAGDRGTITYKDGKVTFTGKDGKTHSLGEDCLAPTRSGNALSLECKNGKFSIDVNGKQVSGKQVVDVNTDTEVKGYIGSIKKPQCDDACTAKLMAALRTYLATKKCDAAASATSIIVTCDGDLSAQDKSTVLDESVATINNSATDVEPAKIEDGVAPAPAKGSASSLVFAAAAMCAAIVTTFF